MVETELEVRLQVRLGDERELVNPAVAEKTQRGPLKAQCVRKEGSVSCRTDDDDDDDV